MLTVLWGGVTEYVQEVLVFARRCVDLGADKDGRATSTSRQDSYLVETTSRSMFQLRGDVEVEFV